MGNTLLLIMTADTNDADYVTKTSTIELADLRLIEPIIEKIKNFKPYKTLDGKMYWTHDSNWPTGEMRRDDLGEKSPAEIYDLTEEEAEDFQSYLPYGENGIHTITTIKVVEVVSEKVYF